ncbi:SMP-30/gluconolactonase/LRE family protein [Mycolicibacterium arenosum]|uniref:SMP-30/gluconolactonase/LRE family protein n=1 Tax=Mycolicibacterium arenosum TaxID=2952157 RepID=UPI0020CE0B6D|nr:SMP-30/gluconolactonase/LRE family protein [Mycolicibacterium sp. CAU 1645]
MEPVVSPTATPIAVAPTATPEAVPLQPKSNGDVDKLENAVVPNTGLTGQRKTASPPPSFAAHPKGGEVAGADLAEPTNIAATNISDLAQARTFSALDALVPTVAADPAPSLLEALVSTSTKLISAGMTFTLKLFASYYGPGGTEDWPTLWGALLLVRRQFNEAFGIENTPIVQGTTAITDPNADGYQLGTIAAKGGEGGGQTDAQGNLYVPAGNKLYVYSPDNELIRVDTLPFPVLDVAPGPNGDYLYVVDGDLIKQEPCAGCAPATPKKLVRGLDGSYKVDPTFKLDTYTYGPKTITPEGYRIATDDQGRLYVAQGMWTQQQVGTVLVYDTDGTLLTRFGDSVSGNQNDPSSYELGKFNNLNGIAVSPDGSTIYTTEATNSRVQVWTKQADGTYKQTGSWGSTYATDPNHSGGGADGLNAPYDIGLDAAGDVYVLSATDAKVVKYHPNGEKVTQMYVGSGKTTDAATPGSRAHGIAVTDHGDAFIPQTGLVMIRV